MPETEPQPVQSIREMPVRSLSFHSHSTYEESLLLAAKLWGVEPDFWDIWGNYHAIPAEVQRAILESMGVEAGSAETLNRIISGRLQREWGSYTPQTLVVSENSAHFPVRLPEAQSEISLVFEVRLEDGTTRQWQAPAAGAETSATAEIEGRRYIEKQVAAEKLPLGYHHLTVRAEVDGVESATRLIVCPDRTYTPPDLSDGGKAAGIAVALYGLRSERNWGCGDFTDLHGLIDWAAEDAGCSLVALNPLHAIPNRAPYNTSPYLPNSSYYLNFIYLDVERLEDFQKSECARRLMQSPGVRNEIQALRDSQYVEYERVASLKLRMLKTAFRRFLREEFRRDTHSAKRFQEFVEKEGVLLDRYAVYYALDEWQHKKNPDVWVWRQWSEEYQSPESPAVRDFAKQHWRSVLFYKYIQWQIDAQLREAQQYAQSKGMPVGLYHDLALATDSYGSDLWAYGRFYVNGCRVGAPPDDFSPNGQDWGFPPPNTDQHRRDGYRLFTESIRKNARHGGALRIDHVMRFFHLYWIPENQDARNGAYVQDYYDDLIRILALESVRNQFVVIGEDLGTVADYIRETLERFGVLSYRLLYFEKDKGGNFLPPDRYPVQALVSVSTHDLPTLAGFWSGRDIEARREVGLIDEASRSRQIEERQIEKQKILDLLFQFHLLPEPYPTSAADLPELTGELHNAVAGFLASTPSQLMVLNQEDLFKDGEQQNLPGTTHQYPNWRHKMMFRVEELRQSPQARDYTRMFRNWVAATGRLRTGQGNV